MILSNTNVASRRTAFDDANDADSSPAGSFARGSFARSGAYDDPNGSHISISVVSDKFQGKRGVQRQQMVYKAIWEEMQGAVHAVDSMVCKTPNED